MGRKKLNLERAREKDYFKERSFSMGLPSQVID